jgi:hypothetical protein
MVRQTLGVEVNKMIDEEEEVQDEEPQEDHDYQDRDIPFNDVTEDHVNRKEGEMAPLDALYPTMRVSSNDEKQQTLHRISAMQESTHQKAVKNETYRENRGRARNVEGEQNVHHAREHLPRGCEGQGLHGER